MFMTKKRHEAELNAASQRAAEALIQSRTKGRLAAEMMAERAVQALFSLDEQGRDCPGFLGYRFRVTEDKLVALPQRQG